MKRAFFRFEAEENFLLFPRHETFSLPRFAFVKKPYRIPIDITQMEKKTWMMMKKKKEMWWGMGSQ